MPGQCPPAARAMAKWLIDYARRYNVPRDRIEKMLREAGIPEECWRDLLWLS